MVCRNICLRYPRVQVGYIAGGKFCRRCEYYFFTERLFCECCGMRLRASPANKEYKEKVRSRRKLISKQQMREKHKLTTPEGVNKETLVSIIDDDSNHQSTNYGRPLKVRGTLKALQDRGIQIKNYNETDGAGNNITHNKYRHGLNEEDEEDEEI